MFVCRNNFVHRFARPQKMFERYRSHAVATFLGRPGAAGIDEYPAHHPNGDREEMLAVLPLDLLRIDQAEVGLVHEVGRLQRHSGPLPGDPLPCEPPQLAFDERDEGIEGILITGTPLLQEPGNVRRLHGMRRL